MANIQYLLLGKHSIDGFDFLEDDAIGAKHINITNNRVKIYNNCHFLS